MLFDQIKEGKVNPAGIISSFTGEDEQNEVGSLFNTRLEMLSTAKEKEQALKDILIKVKTYSFDHKAREGDPSDVEMINRAIENKKQLQELKNIKIKIKEE